MKQTTRSAGSFARNSKTMRQAVLPAGMDRAFAWCDLCASKIKTIRLESAASLIVRCNQWVITNLLQSPNLRC
jgi:hypothetical protein